MLTGTIATLGSHYVITLEAMNPRSGDSIAREQIEAESKEKVLSSLGTAASNLRKKLGESLGSIKQYDVDIEQATTSSLEALKAYAMANDERAKGRARESLTFYKRAIELDPNFAMAYARIGVHYGNFEQLESAKPYVEKAYELRDRVSEREKLYITEKYFTYITGEIDKTIETLQTWSRLYPNDFIPHNNLSTNYQLIGRYDEAVKEALEAVRLSPDNMNAKDNLVASFVGLGRFDEAEQAEREAQKINADAFSAHANNYLFAYIRRDQAAMDRETQWAKGKPEESELTMITSFTALSLGKLKQARELQKRSLELFKQQDRAEAATTALLTMAAHLEQLGQCDEAKSNAKSGLNLLRGQKSLAMGAFVYAACDDLSQAQSLLNDARTAYPKNTVINVIVTPIVSAIAEQRKGNVSQAIQLLDSVRSYQFGIVLGSSTAFLRGNLYLQQRMGKEAAAEFQSILDHPGCDYLSPAHTLAHLGLARAAVINGDTAAARKSYQDFFGLWKDADSDLPVLVQARKEYAELK
jgi:tetratricopeptide (TPR) repeat protein